jgi:hypothetical protein
MCFHQRTRPEHYEQFWPSVAVALPGGEKFHMLGLAAICWAIWKARNRACFEKKLIKNPIEIIFSACALMHYWAGLYPEETQRLIKKGVDLMMKTTIKLIGSKEQPQGVPALQGGGMKQPGVMKTRRRTRYRTAGGLSCLSSLEYVFCC